MKNIWIILFVLFSQIINAQDRTYKLVKEKSSVEFEAIGNPSLLNIKGTKAFGSGSLKFSEGFISGEVLVSLGDFDTDMDTRNEHMKEKYLEIQKKGFETAILKINSKISKFDSELKNQEIDGLLFLHGKENKVRCFTNFQINKEGQLSGDTKFVIKLSEYGIEIPSFAGITIEDSVTARASFMALEDKIK